MSQLTRNFFAGTGKTFTGSALLEGASSTTSLTVTEVGTTGFYQYDLPTAAGRYNLIFLEAGVPTYSGFEEVEPELKFKFVSGSASSFVTDLSSATDDVYNGQVCRGFSGANKGISRKIGNYVGSTKRLEFVQAFPFTPAANDDFQIIGYID
jgi:hypothetical protein